ncbi:unnamed protein product [Lupinus luteus]|uniref:Uncharacterized protein n=1 Tax=Lupinus luteus TaxID=3873 RepID=A0AAV1YFQ3_LUPLU
MDLARERKKAIGAIADSSDREFRNSIPSNLFGQRKLKTPSTGKTDYLILVNVTSAEVTSISTIGRGLSLELRTSSSLSERSKAQTETGKRLTRTDRRELACYRLTDLLSSLIGFLAWNAFVRVHEFPSRQEEVEHPEE